jgi:predicted component of viral defense system (DUF524 family)
MDFCAARPTRRTISGFAVSGAFNTGGAIDLLVGYSMPLPPDVIVEYNGFRHAFDARYRFDRFDVAEGDADDGAATYKRADLYKKHTYRDSITGLNTAFVVFPGSEFVFFDRSATKHVTPAALGWPDGVGAIPLRPADPDPTVQLEAVLQAPLIPLPPATSAV